MAIEPKWYNAELFRQQALTTVQAAVFALEAVRRKLSDQEMGRLNHNILITAAGTTESQEAAKAAAKPELYQLAQLVGQIPTLLSGMGDLSTAAGPILVDLLEGWEPPPPPEEEPIE